MWCLKQFNSYASPLPWIILFIRNNCLSFFHVWLMLSETWRGKKYISCFPWVRVDTHWHKLLLSCCVVDLSLDSDNEEEKVARSFQRTLTQWTAVAKGTYYLLNRVVTGKWNEASKCQGERVKHLSTGIQPRHWVSQLGHLRHQTYSFKHMQHW